MSFYVYLKEITPEFIKYPVRVLRSADLRSAEFHRIFKSNSIHQTTTITAYDRYPRLFGACQKYFQEQERVPKILSFGCSTGEELLSLRKYFPTSEITGVDINQWCLRCCKKKVHDPNIHVEKSTRANIEKYGPYDLIFALAVFQRTPMLILKNNVTNLDSFYPFTRFEEKIVELDASLKIGGLFAIQYAQYRFLDTLLNEAYDSYSEISDQINDYVIFDKDGEVLGKKIVPSIYKKIR